MTLTERTQGKMQGPGKTGLGTDDESIHADSVGYLAAKIVPAISGLLAILVLTRTLEPGLYARYSVLLTACLLGSYLAGAWLCQAVLYYYPTNKPPAAPAFEHFALKLQLQVLAAGVLAYGVAIFLVLHDRTIALLSTIQFSFFILNNLFQAFAQSERRVRVQVVAVIVQSSVHLVALVGALRWLGGNAVAAIALIGVAQGAGLLVLLFDCAGRRPAGGPPEEEPGRGARELMVFGMPLSIWFLAYQFTLFGDRFVLGRSGRLAELGSYAAWRDLATGLTGFLTMPLLMAAHPAILMMWKKGRNRDEIEPVIKANGEIILTMFCPIIALAFLSGSLLLPWALGSAFRSSTFVLVATLLTLLISALNMYNHKGMELLALTGRMAGLAVGLAVTSLGLNLLVAPAYGASGTVAVSLAVQIVYAFASAYLGRDAISAKLDLALLLRSTGWTIAFCGVGVLADAYLPASFHGPAQVIVSAILVLALAGVLIVRSSATSRYIRRLIVFRRP